MNYDEDDIPCTLSSGDAPHAQRRPAVEGVKHDGGKARTDLLPVKAVRAASARLLETPFLTEHPWVELQEALWDWRCGIDKRDNLAGATACILVLLTRQIRGDVRISRILPDCGVALYEVARVLTFGAAKYGDDNWKHVENLRARYYAAALRHLFAHDLVDAESGINHLAHAACCTLFLLSEQVGFDTDKAVR